MKYFILLAFVLSCSSNPVHDVKKDENLKNAFSYCGGATWGYFESMTEKKDLGYLQREFKPTDPFLGVWLNADGISQGVKDAPLDLYFTIGLKEKLDLQIKGKFLTVQIDSMPEKKIPLEFDLLVDTLTVQDKYGPNYHIETHDKEKNQFRIYKKNKLLFNQPSKEFEIVTMPKPYGRKVKTLSITQDFKNKEDKSIWIQKIANIWPKDRPFQKSFITIKTPAMTINKYDFPEKTYTISFNYDRMMKARSKEKRCPTTEEIFRWKDY